ncbi:hypothetical protein BUALT_Bualt11G0035700 [Buddleja alternifolia]|uniref:Uncharacterized protein n=1 Tax=Buddleja alternifolia TaxID=168488 RepID=A0AAV6X318_9LAMI|nr:hypothetical protein BUALT_Bualt11G0035700 [Buddleja alternifolia]
MGSCLSKKNTSSSASSPIPLPKPPEKLKSDEKKKADKEEVEVEVEESVVKKEIFIIKHRKSHEVERLRSDDDEKIEPNKANSGVIVGGAAPVRTSSCTKEEVDAILIQCGRLSRSSSTGKAAALSSENGGRKYSGSKRSYDFDNENGRSDGNNVVDGDDDAVARERENRRRERHRQSQGRRRTPSTERDRDQASAQQQRSGSRERGSSSGGRRVSRSPGRRSESPITTNSNSNSSAAANANSRPGKMVSVPATVSSLAGGGGGEGNAAGAIKRIQVKRNVGGDGARSGASPRARSPARVRGTNDNLNNTQNQPLSLSRSNSRKAEHSPYRRNPLSEIDSNIISQAPMQKTTVDNKTNTTKLDSNPTNLNSKTHEQQPNAAETKGGPYGITGQVALNVISSGPESLKPPNAVARSRSSRLSRDLDINPETLSNPPQSSYTALLLEDIQNFHQKSTPPSFSLPPCLSKACSILDAVADLNSSTSSNLSGTFSEDRRRNPITEQMSKTTEKPSSASNTVGKTRPETRDPYLESEVVVNDDLMEPSFHKYVTVTRGTSGGEELEEEESSGSNSYVGSQQQWLSSSCWEPNSAESTDRWTSSSSRTVTRQNDVSPVGYQRNAVTESGRGVDEGGKRLSAKKRDFDHQQNANGRGRIGSRGSQMAAPAAVAAST